jgi:hypothetical protein
LKLKAESEFFPHGDARRLAASKADVNLIATVIALSLPDKSAKEA